ncbi:hypothetical protein DL98DRAFT_541552 [Cadophora sp. DSE1049]|nr:hypothetical protein DL98DRAFT_541552 [Cadophora sp. DSE1049]
MPKGGCRSEGLNTVSCAQPGRRYFDPASPLRHGLPARRAGRRKEEEAAVAWPGLEDDETGAGDVNDNAFGNDEVGADADFGFDDHDSAVVDFGSENDGSSSDDVAMSDFETEPRQFDALCYEAVRLLVVRNPVAGERYVLAMEIKLAHYKGAQRRPKPAFEAPSLTTVERGFEHKVWGPTVSTPLSWKQEILKTPIFCQDTRPADGVFPFPTLALTYSQIRDCLNRFGLEASFLEKLTSHCFRRGIANVVDRTARDAARDVENRKDS